MDPKGKSVIAGFADGTIRFINYKSTEFGSYSFDLQYIAKPHKGPVTAMAISPDGTTLVTAGEQKTIFLFQIKKKEAKKGLTNVGFSRDIYEIKPISYFKIEAPVSRFVFRKHQGSSEGSVWKIYCALKTGKIISFDLPLADKIDNSLTYELSSESVTYSSWDLALPPPKVASVPKLSVDKKDEKETDKQKEAAKEEKDGVPAQSDAVTEKVQAQLLALKKLREPTIDNTCLVTTFLDINDDFILIGITNKYGEGEVRICNYGVLSKSK